MDKQLIERAAIAAMCAVATSGQKGDASDEELSAIANMNEKDKELTVALFSDFLARIDAERGNSAVALVVDDFNGWTKVRMLKPQPGGTKLFLSPAPTIPEGMALVPIEPTIHMVRAGCQRMFKEGDPTDEPYHIYQAMLAELEGSYATALSRIANFEAWIAEYKAKVAEQSAEIERLQSKLDLLVIERDAQAVLISDQQADVEKQTEISNNFAAQVRQQDEIIASLRAEVERLTKEIDFRQSLLRESNRNCAEHAGVVWTRNVTIDKLKQEARMHAQEARTANATIYEIYQAISGATGEPGNWNGAEPVRTYIKENAALIEKCKCALQCYADQEMRDQWCGPATELLAFIAAQKGGAV